MASRLHACMGFSPWQCLYSAGALSSDLYSTRQGHKSASLDKQHAKFQFAERPLSCVIVETTDGDAHTHSVWTFKSALF
eukprot:5105159-Amphidinium_carterae.1